MGTLTIDGSMGEGGGQVLRSSLALSMLTGTPFRMTGVRAKRSRPGLQRQHLTALRAAAEICGAEVVGAALGSTEVSFTPGRVRGGDYTFDVGTAGSTTLVFQTVFLPLAIAAREPSTLAFAGGTDNPMAPNFEFLASTYLEAVAHLRVAGAASLTFERHGFYPAGGGRFRATISPGSGPTHAEFLERGELENWSATAVVSRLPKSVGEREVGVLVKELGWERERCRVVALDPSECDGPGNVVWTKLEAGCFPEVISAVGERGVPAERVAGTLARETRRFLDANVPVGEHLADQLILPMAVGKGGSYRTLTPSLHTRTQMELVPLFTGSAITSTPDGRDAVRIDVEP